MKSIKDALNNGGNIRLSDNSFTYTDYIPSSTDSVDDKYQNTILKYLEGTITREEHQAFLPSNEIRVRNLYDKYLFIDSDLLKREIDDSDIEDLILLRLTQSEESKQLEKLNQLMFRIYFEKENNELLGLVLSIYEKNEWAKEYVRSCVKNPNPIFQKSTSEYNRLYGIVSEEISGLELESKSDTKEKDDSDDWILSRFGG